MALGEIQPKWAGVEWALKHGTHSRGHVVEIRKLGWRIHTTNRKEITKVVMEVSGKDGGPEKERRRERSKYQETDCEQPCRKAETSASASSARLPGSLLVLSSAPAETHTHSTLSSADTL